MTLADLILSCRRKAIDTGEPPFWSDEQWVDALNEAEVESCIRARLIEDDAIYSGAVALDPYVSLPARAFAVQRVLVGDEEIEMLSRNDFQRRRFGDWESFTGDPVECYRIGDRLRLYPTPVTDADVTVVAFCTPKDQMELANSASVSPEIDERLHIKLVDWALACFYRTPDSDYGNKDLADRHETRFAQTFGQRPNEVEMRRTRIRASRDARGQFV